MATRLGLGRWESLYLPNGIGKSQSWLSLLPDLELLHIYGYNPDGSRQPEHQLRVVFPAVTYYQFNNVHIQS